MENDEDTQKKIVKRTVNTYIYPTTSKKYALIYSSTSNFAIFASREGGGKGRGSKSLLFSVR